MTRSCAFDVIGQSATKMALDTISFRIELLLDAERYQPTLTIIKYRPSVLECMGIANVPDNMCRNPYLVGTNRYRPCSSVGMPRIAAAAAVQTIDKGITICGTS
jgi:hypothetical protein